MSGTSRIHVDFDLCESNAVCESIAPDIFEIDDENFLQVKDDRVTPGNRAAVERAVASCPRSAISIVED